LETAVAENHKALVFSQWTSLLDLLEPALARAELPFVRLDGSTRDRGEVVGRFQAEDGPPVMLVSLKAARGRPPPTTPSRPRPLGQPPPWRPSPPPPPPPPTSPAPSSSTA